MVAGQGGIFARDRTFEEGQNRLGPIRRVLLELFTCKVRYICLQKVRVVRQPNCLRYLLAGGTWIRLGSRIQPGCRKCLKMPQNPASQVHAVLGGGLRLQNPTLT